MADQRIDQLNAETTPAAVDVLPVFSISGSDTKKITVKNLIQVGATLIDNGSIPASKVNLSALNIVNASIDANAEISVSKLADGTARQLLQTDTAGTGVEWASNIDIPGTLDVTGAATFDSTVAVTGTLTKGGSNVVTVGDTGTVTSTMLLNGTILDADINASAEIAVSKLADGLARQLLQTDTAGTGVEWASNIDIPGTLDVTSAATFDSTVAVVGALTKSGSNVVTVGDSGTVTSAMLLNGTILDADISASAEIAVSKLANGLARQLLQTDTAATGVEWASNIDIPGTLDVTGAATFDSSVAVTGALTRNGSNVVTVGDSGTVTSAMLLNGTIVDADINASAEIAVSKLADGLARQLLQTDTAGTGVEWASNIDIPGTLDVTGAATFDSTVAVTGTLTKGGSNVVTVGDTGTVTSTMLLNGTILDADINASAAIAYSKLATLTSGNIILGNSANVATSTAVTGDVTIGNTGATAIAAGVIVDADVNASAAIAYSKLAALTSGNIILGNNGVATSTAVTGDVTISSTGVTAISSGVIVNADVNASAGIVDTKLATIATAGKVSNSATTATDVNTPSAIVSRSASGNFTAGTITAALTGTASGNLVAGGALGTPSSGTLTSCTGLPISTGVSGLGTGAATFLATPSSANLAALLTDETGTGAAVFATSPTFVTPALGTPSSGVLTNCTNLPIATVSVAGAMLPGTGLSVTGGGVVNHTNSVTAGTTSGVTFDAQGHITATTALVGGDLPVATSGVKGAVRPGTGLTVDGSGILDISAATNIALGGVIAGSDFGISTGTISLATQGGLTAGTYTKATFNSKGIATGGTALVAGDIPNLAASQITSGTLGIDRYGANTITGAKLANYSISKISDAFPTADYISQLYFSPLEKTLYMWDGNVYQPIGVSYGQVVFSGTYDAGTNLITSVTTEGAAIGLTVGGALVSPVTATKGHYVVVDQPGTGTAPAPTIALSPPDMLLSNGTTWVLLDVSDTVTAQLASNIQVSPAGNISTTNVQSALQELDDEKLAKAGGTLTGNLALNTGIAIVYEGATTDDFETTLYVVDPTADRTILLPNVSGTVVTTGDTGTVTSAMLLNGTILDADINASAAIVDTKLATIATAGKVSNSATTATNANTASTIVARDASGNFTAGTITAAITGAASSNVLKAGDTMTGVLAVTAGTAALPAITPSGDLNTGFWFPAAADTIAASTAGFERARIDSSGRLLIGTYTSITTVVAAGLQVQSTGATAYASIGRWDNNAANPGLVLNKSRGGSVGTLGIVQVNDSLGEINFTGDDGSAFVPAARIQAQVDGTPGVNDMPGRLVFSTTADGAATLTERLRISNAGTTTLTSAASTAPFIANISASEVARIDSSGRLSVGTSNARSTYLAAAVSAGINVEAAGNLAANNRSISIVNGYSLTADGDAIIYLGRTRSDTIGGTTVVQSNDAIGRIAFVGSDGTNMLAAAQIKGEVDGTPGTNDMPGRLVFSTTADGAASPTERLRITSAGVLQVADAGNITVGTTTGTKIGTATTQKLGFYNATPVVQPAAVADATTAVDVITQLNALLAKLRTLGIIAT